MKTLEQVVESIQPLDQNAIAAAKARLDNLTKPPGSLGKLEDICWKLAGISGQVYAPFEQRQIVLMAGDHGVVKEGVSAFPQEVTGQMVHNFIAGGAAINVLARQAGASIRLVDVGMIEEIPHEALVQRKVRPGTANFAHGPAMSRQEALQAMTVGFEMAENAAESGIHILATGEMGIGNTTASSAILVALAGISPAEAVGRGTGVDNQGLQRKTAAIEKGLLINKPDPDDAMDVLAKVGGLEIAGLAGLVLGAAAARIPVIIDGFISGAAALVAARIAPTSTSYMLASHVSAEPGHSKILRQIGLDPLLYVDMRLGEGTGAALAINLVDAAGRILREMATFDDAGVAR